jgi:hypothetical protein
VAVACATVKTRVVVTVIEVLAAITLVLVSAVALVAVIAVPTGASVKTRVVPAIIPFLASLAFEAVLAFTGVCSCGRAPARNTCSPVLTGVRITGINHVFTPPAFVPLAALTAKPILVIVARASVKTREVVTVISLLTLTPRPLRRAIAMETIIAAFTNSIIVTREVPAVIKVLAAITFVKLCAFAPVTTNFKKA